MTVTPGLAIWKAAIQASDALPCEDAPEPLSSPESECPVAGCCISLVAQEDKRIVPSMAMAASLLTRKDFTVFPFRRFSLRGRFQPHSGC